MPQIVREGKVVANLANICKKVTDIRDVYNGKIEPVGYGIFLLDNTTKIPDWFEPKEIFSKLTNIERDEILDKVFAGNKRVPSDLNFEELATFEEQDIQGIDTLFTVLGVPLAPESLEMFRVMRNKLIMSKQKLSFSAASILTLQRVLDSINEQEAQNDIKQQSSEGGDNSVPSVDNGNHVETVEPQGSSDETIPTPETLQRNTDGVQS